MFILWFTTKRTEDGSGEARSLTLASLRLRRVFGCWENSSLGTWSATTKTMSQTRWIHKICISTSPPCSSCPPPKSCTLLNTPWTCPSAVLTALTAISTRKKICKFKVSMTHLSRPISPWYSKIRTTSCSYRGHTSTRPLVWSLLTHRSKEVSNRSRLAAHYSLWLAILRPSYSFTRQVTLMKLKLRTSLNIQRVRKWVTFTRWPMCALSYTTLPVSPSSESG